MRSTRKAMGVIVLVGVLGTLSVGRGQSAAAAPFTVVAAQTAANAEQNFNGTSKGQLVITVPLGAMVQITFKNNGTLPHSLQIIPPTSPLPATALSAPAFPGAQIKNPQVGINKGQTATVQFTATKAGKYLMICGFPGHALLGMYANFIVADSPAAKPSMTVNK